MGRIISGLALLITLYICATIAERNEAKHESPDSYVAMDTSLLKFRSRAYVPVNLRKTPGKPYEKLVLKIRNTSFLDSIYLSRVEYYNGDGKLLKGFIDSARLIKPMATGELVIKGDDLKEPGDNFIVHWHSSSRSRPIIQSMVLDRGSRVLMTDHGVLLAEEELVMD